MHSRPKAKRLALPALAGLALIVLAICGLWAWQIARRADALLASVAALEAAGRDPSRWPELCDRAAVAAGAARALRSSAGPLLALGPRLAALPRYGPQAAAAGPLLDAADALGAAAAATCAELAALTAPVSAGRPAPAVLTERLAAARPGLGRARADLARADAALARVDAAALPPELGGPVARAAGLLARAGAALDAAIAAPALLGADGPRTYLVVVQNPDELRPTGGFMSAAGLVRVEGGQPTSFDLRDTNAFDNFDARYPLAPDPLRRYMLNRPMDLGLWVFRDANWSPDFPTSARQMLELLAIGQGRGADGVVAVTPDAVRLALAALGPQAIEGSSTPVDAGNVEQELRRAYDDAVAQGRPDDRKSFVNRLAAAMLGAAEGAGPDRLIALARAAEQALDARAAQVYLPADQPGAALLAARGWDGAVRPGDRDFLMVVGANVGYNKVGPSVDQQIGYAVDLSDPAAPLGAVSVAHVNRSPAAEPGCTPLKGGENYAATTVGCYWSYLRVLVPGEAILYDTEVPVVPDSWVLSGEGDKGRIYSERGPADTRVYGALVVVPRATTQRATFRYQLPPSVLRSAAGRWSYRLRLQRQPGVVQRVTVQVLLPAGAELIGASAPPQSRSGQIFTFELSSTTDQALELSYRAP